MVTDLKQIKTRYLCKCNNCARDIKIGWTAYFRAADKTVYCKPCGERMANDKLEAPAVIDESKEKEVLQESSIGQPIRISADDLLAELRLINQTLASIHEQNSDIRLALIAKNETKKETKKEVKNAK